MYTFSWVVPKPLDVKRAHELLKESIETNHYTNGGPAVENLERHIHKLLVLPKDCCVQVTASGTAALHSLVSAYNIYYGRTLQWVTQAYTFPSAVLGPLKHSVVVDNDPEAKGPSLEQLERETFDGLIVTNVFGTLTKIDVYLKWAKDHGKLVIFDNAATPFSLVNGQNVCGMGDGAIVSFHETKAFGRGEGGCVCAPAFLKRSLERSVNFGFDYGVSVRVSHPEASNWRMSDIAAAFLHARLELLTPKVIEHALHLNRDIHAFLKASKHLEPLFPLREAASWFISCICVKPSKHVDIEEISEKYSIQAKRYYVPLGSKEKAPLAWSWYENVVCLPFDYTKSFEEIVYCLESLEEYVDRAEDK